MNAITKAPTAGPRRIGRGKSSFPFPAAPLSVLAALAAVFLPAQAFASEGNLGQQLPVWSVVPFAGLLLCIAVLPLATPHWWEHNRNKAIVALGFGLPIAAWIWTLDSSLIVHTLLEYFSFIVLLGSLFTVSGGIVLRGDIRATPHVNTLFLAIGAVLANLIGTTGASMILIRPMLRTNSERKLTRHIPVFFIFVVSNLGGLLTPLGDPPLFLGYLRGVPFEWTLRLFPIWAMAIAIVLAIFYFVDRRAYHRESPADLRLDVAMEVPLSVAGKLNFLFLGGVIAAVFLPTPWREFAMIAMALASVFTTSTAVRTENRFSYGPIIEVAVLFIGIFLAMVPALSILQARGASLGITQPWQFFWVTGALSSFLDNAPTYLTFLSVAQSLDLPSLGLTADVLVQGGGVPDILLMAISVGAVFMGANSYIGNGPNFMVKAIAEETGLKMPDFFSYMMIAAIVLWPVFIITTFVFFW